MFSFKSWERESSEKKYIAFSISKWKCVVNLSALTINTSLFYFEKICKFFFHFSISSHKMGGEKKKLFNKETHLIEILFESHFHMSIDVGTVSCQKVCKIWRVVGFSSNQSVAWLFGVGSSKQELGVYFWSIQMKLKK